MLGEQDSYAFNILMAVISPRMYASRIRIVAISQVIMSARLRRNHLGSHWEIYHNLVRASIK